MVVEYKELTSNEQFRQCVDLQREVFGLKDVDIFSPLAFNLLTMKELPAGLTLGAFADSNGKENLVGFLLTSATFFPNSLYGMIIGINPKYQNQKVGFKLKEKLREVALGRQITSLYGIFDPLEGNLGNVYLNKFGYWGIKYEQDAYELNEDCSQNERLPTDKVLFRWDMNSARTTEKTAGTYRKRPLNEVLSRYPLVKEDRFSDSEAILVEIPGNFMELKKQDIKEALKWRLQTREIFDEYINNRGFWITEFYSEMTNGKRRNYYLLEKQEGI
jgi:predicted GNAT superfamily acetyltransferase